jgi:hypothetical protein
MERVALIVSRTSQCSTSTTTVSIYFLAERAHESFEKHTTFASAVMALLPPSHGDNTHYRNSFSGPASRTPFSVVVLTHRPSARDGLDLSGDTKAGYPGFPFRNWRELTKGRM